MLYDIAPPLIFFASLGGIIIIVSRVVVRVRHERFAQHIQSHAISPSSGQFERVFQPGLAGVHLVRNRLSLYIQRVKDAGAHVRSKASDWQESRRRKAPEKEIEVPKSVDARAGSVVKPALRLQSRLIKPIARIRHAVASKRDIVTQWFQRFTKEDDTSVEQGVGRSQGAGTVHEEKPESRPGIHLITLEQEADQKKSFKQKLPQSTEAPREQKGDEKEPSTRRVFSRKDETTHVQGALQDPTRRRHGATMPFITRHPKKKKRSSTLAQASAAIHNGEYSQAEDILVPYIVDHTRDVKAYMLLGKIALQQHAWDEAIEIYDQVLKIRDQYPGVHRHVGYAALQAGKLSRALQELQRAHDEEPRNIIILRQLLKIARRLDNKVLEKTTKEQLVEMLQGEVTGEKTKDAH